jgi:hypothetical protein
MKLSTASGIRSLTDRSRSVAAACAACLVIDQRMVTTRRLVLPCRVSTSV